MHKKSGKICNICELLFVGISDIIVSIVNSD